MYTHKTRTEQIVRAGRSTRVTQSQHSHQSTRTTGPGDLEIETGEDSNATYTDADGETNVDGDTDADGDTDVDEDTDADLNVESDTGLDADWDADCEAPSSPEVPLAALDSHAQPPASSFKVCKEEVDAFLHGLQPDMQELTPRFIAAGVVNSRCLAALADMPAEEKQQLLRGDMEMTIFQTRVICVGLVHLRK